MQDIFFQKKSKLVLLALAQGGDKYVSEVAAEVKSTYAHTFNLLKTMEKGGILKAKKKGRIKYVALTEKGRRLAETLKDFEAVLKTTKFRKKPIASQPAPSKSIEKLTRYKKSLDVLIKEVKTKKSKGRELGKYKRLLGRYRSLTKRVRPKDPAGKKAKKDVLALLTRLEASFVGEGK